MPAIKADSTRLYKEIINAYSCIKSVWPNWNNTIIVITLTKNAPPNEVAQLKNIYSSYNTWPIKIKEAT
jgi:hypothetical protein